MNRLLGGNAGASEASEKSVETGYVIRNHLAVNPFYKSAIDAISASEHHAFQWISNPCANGDIFSVSMRYGTMGIKMKGGASRGSMGKSEKQWVEAV